MNLLEDMRLFIATVDARSFTAAAEKLGLSKQFVSRRLADLEAHLGVRLLIRTTRRLSVTELGRVFYERSNRVLDDAADAERAVMNQDAKPRGALRLSAPMSFGTMHLGAVIPKFLSAHPDVSIELDLNDRTVDLVGEGYDMAVRIGVLPDSSLIARAIAPVLMAACCSPEYLLRRGAPTSLDDLRHHDCLMYGHGRNVEWVFAVHGKRRAIGVTGRLRVNNGELARDAALAGLGIALLPTFIVGDALHDSQLVTVLDDFMPPAMMINAVYPKHRESSLTVRAFVDFLRSTFAMPAFNSIAAR
jgi:DNA-binding transcriptional LysR family regulator